MRRLRLNRLLHRRVKPTTWERRMLRVELFEDQKGLCWICGKLMAPLHITGASNPLAATIDHLKPRSKQGGWEKENLRLAHKACNTQRGDHDASEDTGASRNDTRQAAHDSERGHGPSPMSASTTGCDDGTPPSQCRGPR